MICSYADKAVFCNDCECNTCKLNPYKLDVKMKKKEINIVAFIVPTPSFIEYNACGEYNGYVAIPSIHIAYGVRYDDELFELEQRGCHIRNFMFERTNDRIAL